MVIGFIIWSMTAFVFILIGISSWKSKQEAGFITFAKPVKMRDVEKYNHAVGKLWFAFAVILEALGIPFLFAEQNAPIFLFMIMGVMLLIIAIIIVYLRIEKKYKKQ